MTNQRMQKNMGQQVENKLTHEITKNMSLRHALNRKQENSGSFEA